MATATTSLAGFAPRAGVQRRRSGEPRSGRTTTCGRAGTRPGWRPTGSGRSWAASLALGCALAAAGGLVALGAPVAGLVVAAARRALGAASTSPDRTGPLRLPAAAPRDPGRARRAGPTSRRDGRASDHRAHGRPARPGSRGGSSGSPAGSWWLGAAALAVVAAAAARVAGEDGHAARRAPARPDGRAPRGRGARARRRGRAGRRRRARGRRAPGRARHRTRSWRASRRRASRAGLLLAGPDALRSHLRREQLRSRAHRAAARAAPAPCAAATRSGAPPPRRPGWPLRSGGPRGLPAALAPPEPPSGSRAGALSSRDAASSTK